MKNFKIRHKINDNDWSEWKKISAQKTISKSSILKSYMLDTIRNIDGIENKNTITLEFFIESENDNENNINRL